MNEFDETMAMKTYEKIMAKSTDLGYECNRKSVMRRLALGPQRIENEREEFANVRFCVERAVCSGVAQREDLNNAARNTGSEI